MSSDLRCKAYSGQVTTLATVEIGDQLFSVLLLRSVVNPPKVIVSLGDEDIEIAPDRFGAVRVALEALAYDSWESLQSLLAENGAVDREPSVPELVAAALS